MPELIHWMEAARCYGARAEETQRGEGIDFKTLSHALRALEQMEGLLQTSKIIFPLKKTGKK